MRALVSLSGFPASGTVKSCDDGTPIVTTYSPFSTIPDSSKWTTNTTDHIFFENLPDSTGKYEQFKELLKKCRKTRQNLEKAATQSETAASQEESNKDANSTESQTPASASDVIDITWKGEKHESLQSLKSLFPCYAGYKVFLYSKLNSLLLFHKMIKNKISPLLVDCFFNYFQVQFFVRFISWIV